MLRRLRGIKDTLYKGLLGQRMLLHEGKHRNQRGIVRDDFQIFGLERKMAEKKSHQAESERAKRIRDAAREHETDNDPASFDRAFAAVARGAQKPKPDRPKPPEK
jgi:hypothetical protein